MIGSVHAAWRTIGRSVAVALAALMLCLSLSSRAFAAFPGANGLLVFEQESPAGDHTQTDVYSVSRNGTGVDQLTDTPNRNEFGPTWDPAGQRIAFWRTPAPFGTGSLWVMDADGTNQRRLTKGVDMRDPAWDATGTRLVANRSFDLITLRVSDGHDRVPLTSGPELDFEPAWSPDGERIAFTRGFEKGDTGDIYVLTVADLTVHQVTHTAAYDHQVAWSPNGERLVFERDYNGSQASILTVRPDGSDIRRLTTGPAFDVGPAYSPNGRLIAFGSDRSGNFLHDVWVMDRDGGNQHRLVDLPWAEGFPDWQPIP
jgi:Tol biopolymer transport system component